MSDLTYVIGAKDLRDDTTVTVKIGHASSPRSRCKELQTGNPHQLEVLTTFPNAGATSEGSLHAKYAVYKTRARGEWFKLPTAVFDELVKVAEPASLRLTFKCDTCGDTLTSKQGIHNDCNECGVIFYDLKNLRAWRGLYKEWKDKQQPPIPGMGRRIDVFSIPEEPPWFVKCAACYIEHWGGEQEDAYWFCVSRADTQSQILSWTSHLLHKNWVQETAHAWSDFIDRCRPSSPSFPVPETPTPAKPSSGSGFISWLRENFDVLPASILTVRLTDNPTVETLRQLYMHKHEWISNEDVRRQLASANVRIVTGGSKDQRRKNVVCIKLKPGRIRGSRGGFGIDTVT